MRGSHLSPIDLDLMVLGQPDSPRRTRDELDNHLESCVACMHAQHQRMSDQQAFMQGAYSRGLARVQMIKQPAHGRRWLWLLSTLAAPTIAALLVFAVRQGSPNHDTSHLHGSDIGIKGPVGLRLFARRGEAVFPVEDGQSMMAGDALRFVLGPTSHPFLIIGSVDGDGRASIYYPFNGQASAHVSSERPLEAPSGSVILDQAQGPERIFAIWSAEPIASNAIVSVLSQLGAKGHQAIRDTPALGLPNTVQQSILIEKTTGSEP